MGGVEVGCHWTEGETGEVVEERKEGMSHLHESLPSVATGGPR